jgi:hypothetical protein
MRDLHQAESLERAKTGLSFGNFEAIFKGFLEKGIAEEDIIPRENIFTFHAWKALGRVVRKGEHGVKIVSFVSGTDKDGKSSRFPKTTTVFHISQTEEL